jgi:hypothetical protein
MASVTITLRADVAREFAQSIEGAAAGVADRVSVSFTIDNAPATGSVDLTLPDGKKKNH